MGCIEFDMNEVKDFFGRVEKAAKGDFKKELKLFLEGLGNEFLRIVQDEIIRRQAVDSRQLLASFTKNGIDNVWELEEGSLTLEVGTNLDYASYVNDGHWTNPNGVAERFVPGYWNGDRFIYDPSAKGGMLLKQKWVKGKPYWDSALRIIERMYPDLLEAEIQRWLDSYFE